MVADELAAAWQGCLEPYRSMLIPWGPELQHARPGTQPGAGTQGAISWFSSSGTCCHCSVVGRATASSRRG